MGFRFFKRMNILPGVTLNLSKGGGSVSIGPQGAKLTFGTSGARATFGIPGTGLFYTTNFSLKKLGKLFGGSSDAEKRQLPDSIAQREGNPPTVEAANDAKQSTVAPSQQEQLTSDFFAPLTPADEEKSLTAGCQALVAGNEDAALAHFSQTAKLADGAFLAGCLFLKKRDVPEAIRYLTAAAQQEKELGQCLSRYGISATLNLEITEEVSAHVGPDLRGVLLALAEAYQAQKEYPEAIRCLQRLRLLEPGDVVVKLSLAELLMEAGNPTKETYLEVVHLTEDVKNQSAVHAALLLYKAKALRGLSLLGAAQDVLTSVLKKTKDRPTDLLSALRYERALVYEEQRETRKARMELEKLYAEAPDYEDVKKRLGL
jgi:tetratricopeptide (TPR) repeat protein